MKPQFEDFDLLDVLDEQQAKVKKATAKPQDLSTSFKFGRPQTPELKHSKSASQIATSLFPNDQKSPRPSRQTHLPEKSKSTKRLPQQQADENLMSFKSKGHDAGKTETVKAKTVVQSRGGTAKDETPKVVPKETSVKAKERLVSPMREIKQRTDKNDVDRFYEPVVQKPAIQIVNQPTAKQIDKELAAPKISKADNSTKPDLKPTKQSQTSTEAVLTERRQKPSSSPKPTASVKEQKPQRNYESTLSSKIENKQVLKIDAKSNMENELSKLPIKARVEVSKSQDKKKQPEFKLETMDLCQRLNEYTKFKENVNLMNQPDLKKEVKIEVGNQSIDQAKERAESFLKKQIDNFKDKKKTIQFTEAELQKVSQPRHKKQAVEVVNHCSFQPLLAKKSIEIVQKMVNQL